MGRIRHCVNRLAATGPAPATVPAAFRPRVLSRGHWPLSH
jgi:hypothetical protein